MPTIQAINSIHYAILAVALVAWCALHSVMIAQSVTNYLKHRAGEKYRFYRLFFNLIAIITLMPLVLFAYALRTEPLFRWEGYWHFAQGLLLGIAALLFFLGARHYNARQFFGIAQIQDGSSGKGLSAAGGLDTSGVLSVVRHPWYLAGMLLIWARPLDISAMVVNSVLTLYFIVGGYLEERKLVREFGDNYRAYQKRVSMLFPYKWLHSKIGKR